MLTKYYGKRSIRTVYIAGTMTSLSGKEREAEYAFYDLLEQICSDVNCDAYVPYKHTDPETNPDATDKDIYDVGAKEVQSRDLTIAVVTYPSHGVGGEIVLAQMADKPVILVSKREVTVSRFVTGNPSVTHHLEYDDLQEVREKLPSIIEDLQTR